jgi:hypothetical protein
LLLLLVLYIANPVPIVKQRKTSLKLVVSLCFGLFWGLIGVFVSQFLENAKSLFRNCETLAGAIERRIDDLAHQLADGGPAPLRLFVEPRPEGLVYSDADGCFHAANRSTLFDGGQAAKKVPAARRKGTTRDGREAGQTSEKSV